MKETILNSVFQLHSWKISVVFLQQFNRIACANCTANLMFTVPHKGWISLRDVSIFNVMIKWRNMGSLTRRQHTWHDYRPRSSHWKLMLVGDLNYLSIKVDKNFTGHWVNFSDLFTLMQKRIPIENSACVRACDDMSFSGKNPLYNLVTCIIRKCLLNFASAKPECTEIRAAHR